MKYRLGCDIGGTFTDFVLLDQEAGRFEVGKVLTTPHDPSEAVDTGIAKIEGRVPGFLEETEYVIHGTTLVVNALIQRQGARTGLITTGGFRDVLAMRREMRYDNYDLYARYPTPLVSRELRLEVEERVLADGRVLTPLNEDEVVSVLEELADAGVDSIGVCFLHAYANPVHERRLAEIARHTHPDIAISLSSDVLPEIKEFERTSTTVVNAYVKPIVAKYLDRIEARLAQRTFDKGLYLMLSGGGITSTETAREFPVRLIESGPVGGALAAAYLGNRAGLSDVLSFDMGGTTAKACFIRDGHMPTTTQFEVDRTHRFKKGSGTPVSVPTVDVIEIGAGGGSIASVNELGVFQVGPRSAGADPGPICYGRGGREPTITDADLVLGYLDPRYFLGGAMPLDLDAARGGIERGVATLMKLSVEEAAWGIHEVVNENMAAAARIHLTERAGDVSNATLVAFGGAGPVHADGVARKLGVPRLLIPLGAGVFSALGFVVAPVSFEVSRTHVALVADLTADDLETLYRELEAEAGKVVTDASPGATICFTRVLDICYRGQGSTLGLTQRQPDAEEIAFSGIEDAFQDAYRIRYGYAYDDLEVQVRTVRVTATAQQSLPDISRGFSGEPGDTGSALKGERQAWSPGAEDFVPHRVYAFEGLGPDAEIEGPAILEEEASTLIIGSGAVGVTDPRGWIMVHLDGDTG